MLFSKKNYTNKKIVISANEEALVDKSYWICDAEGVLQFDSDYDFALSPFDDEEVIKLTVSQLEHIKETSKFIKIKFHLEKPFNYREPLDFVPEVWHDFEIAELNQKLKKIFKKGILSR